MNNWKLVPRPQGVFDSQWYWDFSTQAPWLFSGDSEMRHLRSDLLIVPDPSTTTPTESSLDGISPLHVSSPHPDNS